MSAWPKNELHAIATANDLHIAPFRDDGKTYGTPTWIWSVAVDDALYVRAYNGTTSRWFQSALRNRSGRIHAAGLIKEVTFEHIDGSAQEALNVRIDAAYRLKYKGSPYLNPMIGTRARAATVRITPR